MNGITDFLYARPTFVEGIARIFDLGGTLQQYNISTTGEKADSLALAMDVQAIGQDMKSAICIFVEENSDSFESQT